MKVTPKKAAEILGCSQPFLKKLLEEGRIEYRQTGRHIRIKLEDVLKYRQQMKKEQKKYLVDIMNFDKEIGLYDPE